MRTLVKNKQKMYYALLKGEEPEYVLDADGNKIVSFVDEDGIIYYKETGNWVLTYYKPVPFSGNISMSGGEINTKEYGIDISEYDALLVLDKDEIPIDEASLLWFESEPQFKDADKTILDPNKADYRVLAIKPSLNQLNVLLGRIVK